MNGSINAELEKLKDLVLDNKNKEFIIDILKKVLNIKFTDFKYKGIKSLRKITEYDFSVLNVVGNLENKEYEIYIKIIKGGEIKKSVFCCWSLLQEEYESILKGAKESRETQNRLDKISIKDEISEEYRNSVHVSLEGNISYSFEVNFIELENFMEKFEPKLQKYFNNLNLSNKDILLIMVRDIKR